MLRRAPTDLGPKYLAVRSAIMAEGFSVQAGYNRIDGLTAALALMEVKSLQRLGLEPSIFAQDGSPVTVARLGSIVALFR